MKFIVRLLLTMTAVYFLPFYTQWWIIFFACAFIGFLIPGNGFNSFNSGFLGGGIIWLGYAFKLDIESQSILSEKIIKLFPVEEVTYLIIFSGLIGAFCAGFATLTGTSFRQIFTKKKQKSFYS